MTDYTDDPVAQARSILGDEYGTLMDNVETALKQLADTYDVDMPGAAVGAVQTEFAKRVVRADESDDGPPIDQLLAEMDDPESDKARTNVSFTVGVCHNDHDALYELANAAIEAKYRGDSD